MINEPLAITVMERTRNRHCLSALERDYGPERYDGGRGHLLEWGD